MEETGPKAVVQAVDRELPTERGGIERGVDSTPSFGTDLPVTEAGPQFWEGASLGLAGPLPSVHRAAKDAVADAAVIQGRVEEGGGRSGCDPLSPPSAQGSGPLELCLSTVFREGGKRPQSH